MKMPPEGNEAQKERPKERNPLLLAGGLFVLGVALAMLLFGGRLFGSGQVPEAVVFEQIPSAGVVNREDVPLPDRGAPLNVGDVAHDFSLSDLDGNRVALSDFRGKPVIINFWATWCPPCRLEMPELQRAYEAYAEDDLVILAVNEAEQSEVVSSFFYEQMGYTFTPLLDEEGQVAEAYGAIGLPASFFVDAAGEVTAVHRGLLTQGQLEQYLEQTIR
jgi:cytochrome c biogenesis protein CcmG/thiol:disulfide interchange protein DsbE